MENIETTLVSRKVGAGDVATASIVLGVQMLYVPAAAAAVTVAAVSARSVYSRDVYFSLSKKWEVVKSMLSSIGTMEYERGEVIPRPAVSIS